MTLISDCFHNYINRKALYDVLEMPDFIISVHFEVPRVEENELVP
jgi:hypothetical protein